MKKRAVIFDIDGTLSDPSHRLHHIKNGQKDWDAFFAKVKDDGLHEPIRNLLWGVDNGTSAVDIILCTGRPEKTRADTEHWLSRHSIFYDTLFMRKDGDYRGDDTVKSEFLDEILKDYDVEFVVDDRPRVVKMWRERGLTCLQCRDWNDDLAAVYGRLTLMVGPSGAGKSTFLENFNNDAYYYYGIEQAQIVSSDQIRQELCDDFKDQSRNDEVFQALHAIVKARVSHGLEAVVDATNIRNKDRLALCRLVPEASPKRYIVVDRPLAEKLRDRDWRPEELIHKHHNTFMSNLQMILAGDNLSNVEVCDLRRLFR